MTFISASAKADLAILNARAIYLKEGLKETLIVEKRSNPLGRVAESITRQVELEEQTMEKIGLCLTPIHINEHKKLLEAIMALEFSWKANRISDEVYIKALNYKFEFHHHYFDEAQLLLIRRETSNLEETP